VHNSLLIVNRLVYVRLCSVWCSVICFAMQKCVLVVLRVVGWLVGLGSGQVLVPGSWIFDLGYGVKGRCWGIDTSSTLHGYI